MWQEKSSKQQVKQMISQLDEESEERELMGGDQDHECLCSVATMVLKKLINLTGEKLFITLMKLKRMKTIHFWVLNMKQAQTCLSLIQRKVQSKRKKIGEPHKHEN